MLVLIVLLLCCDDLLVRSGALQLLGAETER
jgi:hypothetical protein